MKQDPKFLMIVTILVLASSVLLAGGMAAVFQSSGEEKPYELREPDWDKNTLSAMRQSLTAYFQDRTLNAPIKQIIVDNYADLCDVIGAFKESSVTFGYFGVNVGNVAEIESSGMCNEAYFQNHYMILTLKFDGITNPEYTITAEKNGNIIHLHIHRVEPYKKPIGVGRVFYLTPMEGTYQGETFEIEQTREAGPKPDWAS